MTERSLALQPRHFFRIMGNFMRCVNSVRDRKKQEWFLMKGKKSCLGRRSCIRRQRWMIWSYQQRSVRMSGHQSRRALRRQEKARSSWLTVQQVMRRSERIVTGKNWSRDSLQDWLQVMSMQMPGTESLRRMWYLVDTILLQRTGRSWKKQSGLPTRWSSVRLTFSVF